MLKQPCFVFTTTMLFMGALFVPFGAAGKEEKGGEGKVLKIEWYGHSCFLLTLSNGNKLVIDAFDPKQMPYSLPKDKVQAVFATHSHFDHGNVAGINADVEFIGTGTEKTNMVVRATKAKKECVGKTELESLGKGVAFWAIPSFHDEAGGKKRGRNTIFVWQLDGMLIAHLGDLGQVLTAEQLKAFGNIGKIDVLLIPVGGFYTIDAAEATKVVEQLSPKIVIPIHYKTKVLPDSFPISGVDKFLAGKSNVERANSSSITISKGSLPGKAKIVVLKYHGES